jgi:hypothetical protein
MPMEKDMNKEADIVEETAVVNEVTDSSEEIVAVNAAEDISNETTAVNAAAEEQITDSNISHSTLPPKKTRGTAAKIVGLALCCSLVGGAAGAGGVIAVDRLLIRQNTEAVSTQTTAPATQGFRVRKGSRQVKIKIISDSGKLTVIPDAGATTGTADSGTGSGSTSSASSRKKTTTGSSSTSSKKSTSSSDSSEAKTRKKPSSST